MVIYEGDYVMTCASSADSFIGVGVGRFIVDVVGPVS